MRRSHGLWSATTDTIFLIIDNFYDATFNATTLDNKLYSTVVERDNILQIEPIYLYHSSARQYLQSPFALTPLSPLHNLALIDNQYLTRDL